MSIHLSMYQLEEEIQAPCRQAGPPKHLDDKVDLGQWVVNKELSLSCWCTCISACAFLVYISMSLDPHLGRFGDRERKSPDV